jgi:hypothetical protein
MDPDYDCGLSIETLKLYESRTLRLLYFCPFTEYSLGPRPIRLVNVQVYSRIQCYHLWSDGLPF